MIGVQRAHDFDHGVLGVRGFPSFGIGHTMHHCQKLTLGATYEKRSDLVSLRRVMASAAFSLSAAARSKTRRWARLKN